MLYDQTPGSHPLSLGKFISSICFYRLCSCLVEMSNYFAEVTKRICYLLEIYGVELFDNLSDSRILPITLECFKIRISLIMLYFTLTNEQNW